MGFLDFHPETLGKFLKSAMTSSHQSWILRCRCLKIPLFLGKMKNLVEKWPGPGDATTVVLVCGDSVAAFF